MNTKQKESFSNKPFFREISINDYKFRKIVEKLELSRNNLKNK